MVEELMGEVRLNHNTRSIHIKKVIGYRDEWFDKALCVTARVPAYVFDTEEPDFPYMKEAMEICKQCPVRKQCLEYAVTNMPSFTGVVGGQLFWYGKMVDKKPRRRFKDEYNTGR
jgi:hypothetical protein